ncbi:MAG: metallophosphoesterase [Candidatus Odinarchaeia archaeon]
MKPKVFVTSDTHFNHKEIINLANRPFTDVDDMNDTLIYKWNKTVSTNDIVFHLGDIAFNKKRIKADYWLNQLNGNIISIKGNHEKHNKCSSIQYLQSCIIKFRSIDFFLVHNPLNVPKYWANKWVLHGHSHNNTPFLDVESKRINVSVENTNYKPIMLKTIVKYIHKKENIKKVN